VNVCVGVAVDEAEWVGVLEAVAVAVCDIVVVRDGVTVKVFVRVDISGVLVNVAVGL
jgi:hypothetical protein